MYSRFARCQFQRGRFVCQESRRISCAGACCMPRTWHTDCFNLLGYQGTHPSWPESTPNRCLQGRQALYSTTCPATVYGLYGLAAGSPVRYIRPADDVSHSPASELLSTCGTEISRHTQKYHFYMTHTCAHTKPKTHAHDCRVSAHIQQTGHTRPVPSWVQARAGYRTMWGSEAA